MARKEGGLWKVVVAQEQVLSVSYSSTYEEKHESLGHPSIIWDVYKDSPPIPVPKDFNCDICNKQKSQHSAQPTIGIRTEHPFYKIHSDLCGRFNTHRLGKNEYYMTFLDDYTRYCWIYFLKSKDQASIAISNFWQFTQTQFGKTIKRLHSDNGTEYVNQNVSLFLQKKWNHTHYLSSSPPWTQRRSWTDQPNIDYNSAMHIITRRQEIPLGRSLLYSSIPIQQKRTFNYQNNTVSATLRSETLY